MTTRIARPPELSGLLMGLQPETFVRVVNVGPTLDDGRYLHWNDIRRREPPEGLTVEQWWVGMRLARSQSSRSTELVDTGGVPYSYSLVGPVLKSLHQLDLRATGRSAAPAAVVDRTTRDRYKVGSSRVVGCRVRGLGLLVGVLAVFGGVRVCLARGVGVCGAGYGGVAAATVGSGRG